MSDRRPLPLGLTGVSNRLPHGRGIALTFDDGPDEIHTPRLLELLGRGDVRATFFLVGHRVEQHPSLVRQIIAEGHSVGSHSQTHPKPWLTPLGEVWHDYQLGRSTLERVTGRRIALFRPPYGWMNFRSALRIRQHRLQAWSWSLDPEDWRPDATTDGIISVTAAMQAGDVLLLHDGVEGPEAPEALDRTQTLNAVPVIIEQARARKLQPVALAQS